VSVSWFNVSPAGESQGSYLSPSVPSGVLTISVTTGSATYNTLLNDGTISYKGKDYTTFQGPFATEKNAVAALSNLISGLPAAGAAGGAIVSGLIAGPTADLGNTTQGNPANTAGSAVSAGVSAGQTASSWTQAIADFLHRLTEASTWIRVVEVGLGIALAIVALDKLLSATPAGPAVHKVAKAAFLALWLSTKLR
jgi:hypothetical protein